MCGNFSFGDYFKERAIPLAWELLTSPSDGGYGLARDKLWVTVYLDDDEADRHLARRRRRARSSASSASARPTTSGRWACPARAARAPRSTTTAVPSTARRAAPRSTGSATSRSGTSSSCSSSAAPVRGKEDFPILGDLPAKNIDTGMGLERMAAVLQGVDNLYEIDTRPAHPRPGGRADRQAPTARDHDDDVRLRVVADHARTAVMLIGDGVTPGNEGRGYVLRRMMRREPSGACGCSGATSRRSASSLAGEQRRDGAAVPRARDRVRTRISHRSPRPRRSPSGRPCEAGGAALRDRRCRRLSDRRGSRATRRSGCTTPTASRST